MGELVERIVTKYGPLAAIALFLVWALKTDVSGALSRIETSLRDHVSQSNFYLREICINTAKDEAQRANCLGADHH